MVKLDAIAWQWFAKRSQRWDVASLRPLLSNGGDAVQTGLVALGQSPFRPLLCDSVNPTL